MQPIQGKFISGYVKVTVKGRFPELFFQKCVRQQIPIWNMKKISEYECEGYVKLKDISLIRKLKRKTDYTINFSEKRGIPFIKSRLLKRKEVVISFFICICLIIFLSNVIWKIEVTGVPQEVENKIQKQLNSYGIHKGAWTMAIASPKKLQQELLNDVPELLWIGVKKKGTSLHFEGVEKEIVEIEKVYGPRHLIATKKGIIKKMYVSKGVPKKQVNDLVKKGDILVSGELADDLEELDEDKDKDNKKKGQTVAATGEITAQTWYETEVTIPLEATYETVTGNQEKSYALKIKDFKLPFWGIKEPDFKAVQRETEEKDIYFFKWQLPIKFMDTTVLEKKYNKQERTKEEAIEYGIKQAKKELELKLGSSAKILTDKILHERMENGKVILRLYITVEEDIVSTKAIED